MTVWDKLSNFSHEFGTKRIMLEPVRYTNIGDICVTDLIFYDEDLADQLIAYCKENAISFIPDRDRRSCWKLEDGKFQKLNEIPQNLSCNPTDLIFSSKTIGKFEDGNHDEVMFVVENHIIKGVVHIVDYNNPNLYVELYRMLLNFENNLRNLLIRKDFKNEDVIDWFKTMSEEAEAEKDKEFYKTRYEFLTEEKIVERMAYSNPFQIFYLRELTEFVLFHKLMNQDEVNPFEIGSLRNWIAHSKDATSVNSMEQHPVYNMKGLKKFIGLVRSFFRTYDLLEMKLEECEKTQRLQRWLYLD